MSQPNLFGPSDAYGDVKPISGDTFDPGLDSTRLNDQGKRVFELMRDGQWRTLAERAVQRNFRVPIG